MQPDDFESSSTGLRNLLRVVGPILVGIGAIFIIVALIDFFSAFGGMNPPTKFWCFFVGGPLIALGSALCRFGYMGAVARYMAEQVSPVGKDVVNYLGQGTKGTVRDLAAAASEGFHSAPQHGDADSAVAPQVKVRCAKCHALNNETAKFCNQCGAAL